MTFFHLLRLRKKQRGFTLTEIAIVLGIMSIILGGIWSAASKVYTNRKVTAAVQQIINDANSIKALYPTGVIQGGGVLSALLINSGAIGANTIASCTGLTWGSGFGSTTVGCEINPWNEQVAIGSQTGWYSFAVSQSRFEFLVGTMTNQQCASFLAALVPQATQGGLVQVYSDSMGQTTVTTSTPPTTFSNCSGVVGLQFQL